MILRSIWTPGKRAGLDPTCPCNAFDLSAIKALSGLKYLHSEGVMHRDLKLKNILVTKWDAKTDIPTIKLADFGLAGIGPEHDSFVGTEGYVALEIRKVNKRIKLLKKQKYKGIKTVVRSWLLIYTYAVDIRVLGKILKELVDDVPSRISHRGKTGTVNKKPALSLIDQMLQDGPLK
jgi:serine/threonine protein kinase